jgi:hypothetical protein
MFLAWRRPSSLLRGIAGTNSRASDRAVGHAAVARDAPSALPGIEPSRPIGSNRQPDTVSACKQGRCRGTRCRIGASRLRSSIMKLRTCLLLASLLGTASLDAMACYTVYDASNRVLYQGEDAPVDMTQPTSRSLRAGAHMVFDQGAQCRPVGIAEMARPTGLAAPPNTAVMGAGPAMIPTAVPDRRRTTASTAPLLTDRRTAIASKVPFTVLSGDVVMVPASHADRVITSTVSVIPSGVPVATIPGTSVMGGPPAALPRTGRAETVITELHNPPVTVEQRGNQVLVNRY